MVTIDRRQMIAGALGAATAGTGAPPVVATGVPRWRLGDWQISVYSDGHMVVPAAQQALGADPDALARALAAAGQAGERIEPAMNITLAERGDVRVLFDTGAGAHFMPTTGKLRESLSAVGIAPQSITHVVFTHAHPDHIWGTLDDFDDEPVFAAATYVIAEAEWNFWMAPDAEARLPEDRKNFAAGARRNLGRVRERIRTVKPGAEIVAGIVALDTSGHTAGHMSAALAGGGESLVILGDALIHPVISFQHPEWRPAGDHHDPAKAVETRKRLLDRLAGDRSRIVGYHLPAPGLGRVERRGTGYRFVAGG